MMYADAFFALSHNDGSLLIDRGTLQGLVDITPGNW